MKVKAPFYVYVFRNTPNHPGGFTVRALQGRLYNVVMEWYSILWKDCWKAR